MLSLHPYFGLPKRCCQANPVMFILSILTWKRWVKRKAKQGPLACVQELYGTVGACQSSCFFSSLLLARLYTQLQCCMGQHELWGCKKRTFSWYISKMLYRLCAKSHLSTQRLQPMECRNKLSGSQFFIHYLIPPQDVPVICFLLILELPTVTRRVWLLPGSPFSNRRNSHTVLVLAGISLIVFIVAGMVLCFGLLSWK